MTTKLSWMSDEVLQAVHGKTKHLEKWDAKGVSIDSRSVSPGDLFIALSGPSHDGHDYVAKAISAGAVAGLVSQQPPDLASDAPLLFVEDTFLALQDLGRAARARAKAKIIAVTGSVGKTGTKEMLRVILSATGETYANEGSLNNHWGVPLSLARMPEDAQYGVFELGMNHAGELGPLAQLVQPHVALITNVEAVHLEFFASVDAIAEAKGEIFDGLSKGGVAIINRDNPGSVRLDEVASQKGVQRILGFGQHKLSEARLLEYRALDKGCEVVAEIIGRPVRYQLGASGKHLALNSLAALLAAASVGADIDSCARALSSYSPPQGRGVAHAIRLSEGEITLLDETYNASPVAVRAALEVLSQLKPAQGGRRILALGDMRELGDSAPALHAALAKDITLAKIDRVHCCGDLMAHLYEALPSELRGFYAKDSAALAPQVAADLRAGDIITVKGSKLMNMSAIVHALEARAVQGRKLAC